MLQLHQCKYKERNIETHANGKFDFEKIDLHFDPALMRVANRAANNDAKLAKESTFQ